MRTTPQTQRTKDTVCFCFMSLDKSRVLKCLVYSNYILEKRLTFNTVLLNNLTSTLKILLEAAICCHKKQELSH